MSSLIFLRAQERAFDRLDNRQAQALQLCRLISFEANLGFARVGSDAACPARLAVVVFHSNTKM
jgi:hypothetical protein